MIYWHIQDFKNIPAGDYWLSEQEKEIQKKFIYTKRKSEWRLGRWVVKNALHKHLSLPVRDIEVLTQKNGAPRLLINKEASDWAVSLSHREKRGLCALSEQIKPIGCDLEFIEPRSALFIKDYFTRDEIELINKDSGQKHLMANLIWSAKESVSKVLQLGLNLDTLDINVHSIYFSKIENWSKFKACLKTDIPFNGFWSIRDNFIITMAAKSDQIHPHQI